MSVEHVELLVEERSMEVLLRALLPTMLPAATFDVHPYEGKPDLLRRLPDRLRGYRNWLPPDWRIVVLMDRDEADCRGLKHALERAAAGAGLLTRSKARDKRRGVVNRLAIEELEAWYFGDWEAVRSAYPRVPATLPSRAAYRDPDAISGGTWEAFERVLKRVGYFRTGLRKIEAARAIGPHMVPERNTSASFAAFRTALHELTLV